MAKERTNENPLEGITNVTVVTHSEDNSEVQVYIATNDGQYGRVTAWKKGSLDDPIVVPLDSATYIKEIQDKLADSEKVVYRADKR